MPSHSLLRRLSLLLIIHYSIAVPADPNYLTLNSNGNTAVFPSLSSSGDGSTGDLVATSQGGPVDATSDSQWQQDLDSLGSDNKESSGSLIAGKKNGCQASADQDSLSKRDQDLCSVNPATMTPTKLQEAGHQEAGQQSGNAQKSSGTPEQKTPPLPKPQPVDLPEDYQVCAIPGMNVPVCAPDSFAIGKPISSLVACSLPWWTSTGPMCNWFLKYENLWCCGHAALKLRNRRPQGSLPEGSPPDQSASPTVPTFDQLHELTLNLDQAAPPYLDDIAYPYEAINCVQSNFRAAHRGLPD